MFLDFFLLMFVCLNIYISKHTSLSLIVYFFIIKNLVIGLYAFKFSNLYMYLYFFT